MCGAVNLAATAGTRERSLRTPLLYNAGRLVSYTALGGVAEALGGVVSMSRTGSAVLLLAATAVMVAMSLRMAGVITLRPPRAPRLPGMSALRRLAGSATRGRGSFAVGLLNGAMPCGPLQAMQLYALSTGSFAGGALSMLMFCLGTVPHGAHHGLPHRRRLRRERRGARGAHVEVLQLGGAHGVAE
ncbi:MAG: sulfite exporter TauE/SafE family protein [Coriobacteriales bacterium]|jgi:sulfite exporter TauE/SafE